MRCERKAGDSTRNDLCLAARRDRCLRLLGPLSHRSPAGRRPSSHHPDPLDGGGANPLANRVRAFPFSFDEPAKLTRTLEGVEVLSNTYWVRFNHRGFTHAQAVQNTLTLFDAARRARVRRVVHVSITNPREDSPLEYFAGKARLECTLVESGLSHAILRPTGLFGREDISDQQHRLSLTAVSVLHRVWRRLLPSAAHLRRSPGRLGHG